MSKTTNSRKQRDFSEKTKRILGERVAYICSNPMCRRLTIKPHSSENKSNRLGEGGHIYGASVNGPRYDSTKSNSDISSYDNGIWVCNVCHKLIDTENSTYDSDTLYKWKIDTEMYVNTLVIQDTRLRQLRLLCQKYLTALRILSALPSYLDQTFQNPNGNNIELTRLLMELELILFDHEFIEEADLLKIIISDLDNYIIPFVNHNSTGKQQNISIWKNDAVKIFMLDIMRFSNNSYKRYLTQEIDLVQRELLRLNKDFITPKLLVFEETDVYKITR